ncbi:MAG: nitrogenase-stabilizing/protective protein NifW [Okeania sp. SIO2H7]|nr:nitrogenase-stabilizing/protective protein NifW [Okeania sp. SIO2H7]
MTQSITMSKSLADFKSLVDAEEYFQFFELVYDQKFVNVNRLHILKQFSLLIEEIDKVFPDLNEAERLEKYKQALAEAYEVFKSSSPLETKLFKVFHDKPKNVVLIKDMNVEEA